MSIEAMKRWLECANRCQHLDGMYSWDDVVAELRQAIEQAEQAQPSDARACEVYTQGEWVLYPLTIAAEAKERGWPIRYLVPAIEQAEHAQPIGHFVCNNGQWVQIDKHVWPNGSPLSKPLYTAPPPRQPLTKAEWPKHPSPYRGDEYIGYGKTDLDEYATQVLAAHGIKE